MRVGLLHYSGPPTVGGVEQTLNFHSLELANHGHQARLIVGIGESFDPRIEVRVVPHMYSKHPQVLAAKSELDAGRVGVGYMQLREQLAADITRVVEDLERLVVHNALTLHKNLALTAALYELHCKGKLPPMIGWHHDFAWDREGYADELHEGEPWDLLRKPWGGVMHVAVSAAQQARLAQLYRIDAREIQVIPPGVDLSVSSRWTGRVGRMATELRLVEADLILLLPARITRRKNIEFGIRVHAAMQSRTKQDIRLLITGPPGPHNPQNLAYARELEELVKEFGTAESVHFLSTILGDGLDDESMAALYLFCDALLFPSREEGFGIPLLEAAYARMPIFCSDIPPFHESAGEEAHFFDLDDRPDSVAGMMLKALDSDPGYRLRRRVRSNYSWANIVESYLLPLLEGLDHD